MKKNKKNNREQNIKNTIKSILLSDREINSNNIKFSVLKEILLSDKKEELFQNKTIDFRKLVIFYNKQIDSDPELLSSSIYFNELERIRINRVNQIVKNGQTNDILLNKMKDLNRDLEIEENWVDRGYTFIPLINGAIEVKIEDLVQLEYQIKMLELETINNIVSSTYIIDKSKLNDLILKTKEYSLKTYGIKPKLNRNVILVGQNEKQLEKIFLYYCLTDGKVHLLRRIKYM